MAGEIEPGTPLKMRKLLENLGARVAKVVQKAVRMYAVSTEQQQEDCSIERMLHWFLLEVW